MTTTQPIPVTVLSGFLGAGKTTILNHLIRERHGKKLAIIVNDMSTVNIDASVIANNEVALDRATERLVELSNGCICCTLREDLLIEVSKLAHEGSFDAIIIESSGISEPLPVAETFTFEDERGFTLQDIARLDSMVTVVDTLHFFKHFSSSDSLEQAGAVIPAGDTRTLVHLLTDQIEFADIVVLTKTDIADAQTIGKVRAVISKLNPEARIYVAENGVIDPALLIDTGLFSMASAENAAGWLKEIRGEHVPETEEYGIKSFVFIAHKPFYHKKLLHILKNNELKNVIRSKGFTWTTKDAGKALMWSHAGNIITIDPYGHWKKDSSPFGFEGEQKIVFIGIDMDSAHIQEQLTEALVE
jgi:G3E family GTPase